MSRRTTGGSASDRSLPGTTIVLPAALGLILASGGLTQLLSQPRSCDMAALAASPAISMPANPGAPIATADGCWLFLTLQGAATLPQRGLAVFRNDGHTFVLHHMVPGVLDSHTALTRDETILVATGAARIEFYDVAKLKARDSTALLGRISGDLPTPPNRVMPTFSPDERFLFVANERVGSLTVIDMARARASGFSAKAIVGYLPTGRGPVSVVFTHDGKRALSISQSAPVAANWPNVCRPEGSPAGTAPDHPMGVIQVFDYAQAVSTPDSVTASNMVSAGCNPVRLITDADGKRGYVTARGSDELLVFDLERLVSRAGIPLIATVPIGPAPVAIALVKGGAWAAVTSSNRFNATPADTMTVSFVDLSKVSQGRDAIVGTILAGAFPRALTLLPDGRTLLIANFLSRTIQVVDIVGMTLRPR